MTFTGGDRQDADDHLHVVLNAMIDFREEYLLSRQGLLQLPLQKLALLQLAIEPHVERVVFEQIAQDRPLRDEAAKRNTPSGGKNQGTERRKEGKKSRSQGARPASLA